MNRRDFLKGTAAAGAAAVLPLSIVDQDTDYFREKIKTPKSFPHERWSELGPDDELCSPIHPAPACCCEPENGEMVYCDRHKPPHLKMFTNQHDWVIATSQRQAEMILVHTMYGHRVWQKHTFPTQMWTELSHTLDFWEIYENKDEIWGYTITGRAEAAATGGMKMFTIWKDEIEGEGWEEMPMTAKMEVWEEDSGEVYTKTVREWIDEWGEGYFVSTEW
ncbi:MAG: twin-arginine translocation signal domain-containing protein [Candidatus Hermodarchaeia archaeon]|jgi:hypothetical protein